MRDKSENSVGELKAQLRGHPHMAIHILHNGAYFFGRENQINPREKFSIFGRENELRP